LRTCQILYAMKNDRSGPKSGPKKDSRADSKPSAKRTPRAASDERPKRNARADTKSKTSPVSSRDPRSETSTRPKKDSKTDRTSGMSAAAKREQRLEIESNLKKDYKSAPKTRASAKREVKPAFDAKPKRDFGDDAKPAPKKAHEGSFSPKIGLKRPEAPASEKRAPSPVSKSGEKRGLKTELKGERGATQAFPPKRYINVYLSLGSNMGDRKVNLGYAAMMIDKNIGKIARKSHIYETEPWGKAEQELYLNQVLMVNTTLDPRDLLEIITHIENELGRVRTEKWGPRTIDIDILFYGKRVVRDKGLDIPHSEMHKRAFVLVPLMEIAPELEHPVLKQPIDELYMACKDPSEVVMID
jgi:2-amino-4-hydroxy-6-hydroxymethyldihydropteridine diphosphokinase